MKSKHPSLPVTLAFAFALSLIAMPAAAQRFANPVDEIAGKMRMVVRELKQKQTGSSTQNSQLAIVSQLDVLIKELEEQEKQCQGGGSSNANPNRPLPDSRIIGGPGGIGDLYSPRAGGKKWAELPAAERDRILQSMNEGFPPHYRKLLERYYRRLAEEPSAAVPDAKASSADSRPVSPAAASPDAPSQDSPR